MPTRSLVARLTDMIEAIERGMEIVSEASRHLPDGLKERHPGIPWRRVPGIGNILRHDYGRVAAPVMWTLVRDSLPPLYEVCRAELALEQAGDDTGSLGC